MAMSQKVTKAASPWFLQSVKCQQRISKDIFKTTIKKRPVATRNEKPETGDLNDLRNRRMQDTATRTEAERQEMPTNLSKDAYKSFIQNRKNAWVKRGIDKWAGVYHRPTKEEKREMRGKAKREAREERAAKVIMA